MAAYGVTFGNKHSIRDWGLLLNGRPIIGTPEPKAQYVEIEGSDGGLDFTESLAGRTVFKSRTLEFTFVTIKARKKWSSLYSDILNYLHGQQMKIILDEDPGYYYWGRASVNEWKSDERYSTISIDAVVEPYKLEQASSLEDWLWDPFDFENGVIREYAGLAVDGTLEVTIPGSRMAVVPIITASAAMTVEFEGQTYDLIEGENEIPEIEIFDGENVLTFTGEGTVSIDYRGGSL